GRADLATAPGEMLKPCDVVTFLGSTNVKERLNVLYSKPFETRHFELRSRRQENSDLATQDQVARCSAGDRHGLAGLHRQPLGFLAARAEVGLAARRRALETTLEVVAAQDLLLEL